MYPVFILLLLLVAFMILGVPLGFSIFLSSVIVAQVFTSVPFWQLMQKFYGGINSFVLVAIPLFLLAGNIMNEGKITDKLIRVSSAFVGRFRGGLGQVNVLVSMLFGGISGSAVADTSGIGTILIPAMHKKGYSKSFSVSITSVSSVLGQIIPPSLIMIIYSAASSTSVRAMFLAGIIPGILIGVTLMGACYVYALKFKYPREERMSIKEKMYATLSATPTMVLPLLIIGGVVSGIFTATESSVIAALYGLVLTVFFYRTVGVKKLFSVFVKSAKSSANTLFCIGSASILGYLLAYFRVNIAIQELLEAVSLTPATYILFLIGLFVLVGTFMDAAPAIYIFVPIVVPVGVALGLHPVHIGIVICLVLGFGLVTPPYGLCLLLASSIARIDATKVMKDLLILLGCVLVILLIVAFFPGVVLAIPRLIIPQYL